MTTEGDETVIRGGCAQRWLTLCRVRITVTLPASADLRVVSQNGRVTAESLTGDVDISTSNSSNAPP